MPGMRVTRSAQSNKRQKIQASHSAVKVAEQSSINTLPPPGGRTLPWQTLPYQALVSIMQYAAYPLTGSVQQQQSSVNWLCATGRLCRSFHEACTAALLYSPPLYSIPRAEILMRLLKKEKDGPTMLSTAYGTKIRYLDLEVKQLLARKNRIPFSQLIALTPQVKGIRFYSIYDKLTNTIWAKPEARKIRWMYPSDLADRLEQHNITLRSFEWNARFLDPKAPAEHLLMSVH
jgi:hypothetical protein